MEDESSVASSGSSSSNHSLRCCSSQCKIRWFPTITIYESLERNHVGKLQDGQNGTYNTVSFENEPETEKSVGLRSTRHVYCGRHVMGYSGGIVVVAVVLIVLAWFLVPSLQRSFTSQAISSEKSNRPLLFFQKRPSGRNEFKIIQITDIHLGEAEDLDWGPQQDRKTWKALDAVLTAEAPIDLIVLGGDQLTANNCKDNATAYYQELGTFLTTYGIPWALIFGNHDDTDFETNDGQRIPPKYLRKDLLAMDQSFLLSLTQSGPEAIDGTTNYVLDIYHPSKNNETSRTVAAEIFFLDSGGGSIEKAITDSQVNWVRNLAAQSQVPAVAFQHIPTQAHTYVDDGICIGLHDDGVDTLVYDGGIIQCLSETERFFFLAVGHNHGNDYCCPYEVSQQNESMLHVCFGRHSGYGGYGHWERGCRVYQLEYDTSLSHDNLSHTNDFTDELSNKTMPLSSKEKSVPPLHTMRWSSWVRLESGEVIDHITH